jgi:hypothetical protein
MARVRKTVSHLRMSHFVLEMPCPGQPVGVALQLAGYQGCAEDDTEQTRKEEHQEVQRCCLVGDRPGTRIERAAERVVVAGLAGQRRFVRTSEEIHPQAEPDDDQSNHTQQDPMAPENEPDHACPSQVSAGRPPDGDRLVDGVER